MKKFLLRSVSSPIINDYDLHYLVSRKLKINQSDIADLTLIRKSIDARKRNNLRFNFTVEVTFNNQPPKHPDLLPVNDPPKIILPTVIVSNPSPIIIGAGPSGLFCALAMVEKGLKPIIYDRGNKIENRKKCIKEFWQKGILNEDSNIQFGEGGAGTFSDGKLTARNRDIFSEKVFDSLVTFGADKEIQFEALPHLGTDKLEVIITNISKYLESMGCEFHWNSKLTELKSKGNKIISLRINNEIIRPETVVLGVGNAARDIFTNLHQNNIAIESKDFAMGVRIEHSQDYLNNTFYGDKTDFSITGPATYRLTRKVSGTGVYSFCMCPGGLVINGTSENESIVTNGMSNSSRTGKYGNSAIVVTVNSDKSNPFFGMELQKSIEQKAFRQGYQAPVQSGKAFLSGKNDSHKITGSFLPGTVNSNLHNLLPKSIAQPLKTALTHWDKNLNGFAKNGVLIAPETRTSSPIRIVRDYQTRASVSATNLYPIGEGAGYAGGIISSAVDGWKTGSVFELKG